MTKKFLLKFVIFLFMISGMFSADLYYGNKIIINTNEKVAEIILTELKQPIDKTASADIPIIKIGNEVVYYPEFEFYLLATKKDFEAFLGDGVWRSC